MLVDRRSILTFEMVMQNRNYINHSGIKNHKHNLFYQSIFYLHTVLKFKYCSLDLKNSISISFEMEKYIHVSIYVFCTQRHIPSLPLHKRYGSKNVQKNCLEGVSSLESESGKNHSLHFLIPHW